MNNLSFVRLLDLVRSLTQIMADETQQLALTAQLADHMALGKAKQTLVGQLEVEIAQLNREQSGWDERLSPEEGAQLIDVISELNRVASANAEILKRQLELSGELLDALTREAKRASGNGGVSYHSTGTINHSDRTGPISINTAF